MLGWVAQRTFPLEARVCVKCVTKSKESFVGLLFSLSDLSLCIYFWKGYNCAGGHAGTTQLPSFQKKEKISGYTIWCQRHKHMSLILVEASYVRYESSVF